MFNFHKDPLKAHPSSHRRLPDAEGEALERPVVDKERAVAHYTGMAAQAARERLEHEAGRKVMSGEIDVSGALVALDAYEEQLAIAGYVRVFDS